MADVAEEVSRSRWQLDYVGSGLDELQRRVSRLEGSVSGADLDDLRYELEGEIREQWERIERWERGYRS